MRWIRYTFVILTLVATACGEGATDDASNAQTLGTAATTTIAVPATSAPSADSVTTSSPTTTAGASTTSTVPPGPIAFEPIGHGVLVAATQSYNNPGVIIERDGLWHMFANDFRAWPGLVKVRHYTSIDGVGWEEATGTLYTSERSPFGTPQITIGGFVSDDDVWTLYFHTYNGVGRPAVIGRASAPAAEGPWTVHDEAVLEPGEEGAWDDLRVTRPSIVDADDVLYMYYLGESVDGTSGVGVATSVDGVEWTRHPELVMVAQGWEEFLDRPDVVLTDVGFVMIYRGDVQGPMGVAVSDDGFAWTRVSDQPAFMQGREVEKNFYQGELHWSPDAGLRFYVEVGLGRSTNVYGWSFVLP